MKRIFLGFIALITIFWAQDGFCLSYSTAYFYAVGAGNIQTDRAGFRWLGGNLAGSYSASDSNGTDSDTASAATTYASAKKQGQFSSINWVYTDGSNDYATAVSEMSVIHNFQVENTDSPGSGGVGVGIEGSLDITDFFIGTTASGFLHFEEKLAIVNSSTGESSIATNYLDIMFENGLSTISGNMGYGGDLANGSFGAWSRIGALDLWGFSAGDTGYICNSAILSIDFKDSTGIPTPEPSTIILLSTGLVGLVGTLRKKTTR